MEVQLKYQATHPIKYQTIQELSFWLNSTSKKKQTRKHKIRLRLIWHQVLQHLLYSAYYYFLDRTLVASQIIESADS